MAAAIQAKSKYTNKLLCEDMKSYGKGRNVRRGMGLKVITSLWLMFDCIYTVNNL